MESPNKFCSIWLDELLNVWEMVFFFFAHAAIRLMGTFREWIVSSKGFTILFLISRVMYFLRLHLTTLISFLCSIDFLEVQFCIYSRRNISYGYFQNRWKTHFCHFTFVKEWTKSQCLKICIRYHQDSMQFGENKMVRVVSKLFQILFYWWEEN